MKIVLVGGGTGGHFYPLIAVAEELRRREQESGERVALSYFGPSRYDLAELERLNIQYKWCPSGKWRQYASIRNFFDLFKLLGGIIVAFFKLLFSYPDVIFSKGGYTSVPVILAARMLRIPLVVHESDTIPGRATTLGAKAAKYIAVSYPEMLERFPQEKTALVGIPVRDALRRPLKPEEYTLPEGFNPDLPTLLIVGASSGAERINHFVLRSLDTLLPQYNVLHQTGKEQFPVIEKLLEETAIDPALRSRYRAVPYLDAAEMHRMLTVSDLVVSRAGSTSIFEIALHAKPSILIPIPESISRDQRTNAYTYAGTGAAAVIEEENLTENLFAAEIARILGDNARYVEMIEAARAFATPDANKKIADALLHIARTHAI